MNKPLRNVPLPKQKATQGDVAGKEVLPTLMT